MGELDGGDDEWFCKPRRGFGSRGTKLLTRHNISRLSQQELGELLIQERCKSPEVTVDSFYDASQGRGYAYCRERLEVKAGVCTKAKLYSEPELVEFASLIGSGLRQRGTISFQAMRSSSGWVVTDLNLRPGAGTAMTCAAGFDVLSAAIACRNGENYERFLRPIADAETFFVTRQYSEFVTREINESGV
jgi:hypothetical protein